MAFSSARRRQRSTRLVVAIGLLLLAALLVIVSVTASAVTGTGAAITAVVLGAAATRITYAEVLHTRHDWARDRAEQAQAFREVDVRRSTEHQEFVAYLRGQSERRELAMRGLETLLTAARGRAHEMTVKFHDEARRAELAEDENALLTQQVTDAEERAAEAIVRLAELEQELDVAHSELIAWQALSAEQSRKHA